ncbi:unnamed protein product [Ixodes pacificus]
MLSIQSKTCWVVWEFDYTQGQLFWQFRRRVGELAGHECP